MGVGVKIRNARLAKGMTQEELGELLGIKKSAVAKYENGRIVNIKRSNLKKISEVLGIPAAELIGDYETEKPVEIDGLTGAKLALVKFAQSVPEEKAALALRLLKASVEEE